ncbi:MAG: zinc metallopeptidase, partial [Raoultibacter sp.]
KFRSALVPVVNLASNAWMFVLFAGIFLSLAGLIDLAIILYAAAVIFQIVTLPVEFNASKRAMAYLGTTGITQTEQSSAFSVLRACAFTYVAAALTSILQLLYLLTLRDN